MLCFTKLLLFFFLKTLPTFLSSLRAQKTKCLTIPIPQSKWPIHDPPHDMNNALPPSSSQSRSQALPPAPTNNNDGAIPSSTEDDDNDTLPANNNPDGGDDGGDTTTTTTTPEQRARRLRILKTTAFLDHLIRSFDLVVYCQISILYYMEYVHGLLLISPPPPPYIYTYMHERDIYIYIYIKLLN